MIFINSYISVKNYCRYRPPKNPQHDLALVKVIEPIEFSVLVMPICLPWSSSAKFPDTKGYVHVAGWGLHHESTKEADCTTGKRGPDPFSKCKFPFSFQNSNEFESSLYYKQCLRVKPPSQYIKGCKDLLKLMKRKNETANLLDKGYGRVSTFIFLIGIVSRVQNLSFLFKCESCCL